MRLWVEERRWWWFEEEKALVSYVELKFFYSKIFKNYVT
jgi:uncharacterized membrane protein